MAYGTNPGGRARGSSRDASFSACLAGSPSSTLLSEGPALSLLHEQTGPAAFTAASFEGPGLYQMGLVDVLQRWTLEKRCEHLFATAFLCRGLTRLLLTLSLSNLRTGLLLARGR